MFSPTSPLELKFAAAFVDQKDEQKPIVLLITDQKLPVEKSIREGSSFLLRLPWRAVASCEGG